MKAWLVAMGMSASANAPALRPMMAIRSLNADDAAFSYHRLSTEDSGSLGASVRVLRSTRTAHADTNMLGRTMIVAMANGRGDHSLWRSVNSDPKSSESGMAIAMLAATRAPVPPPHFDRPHFERCRFGVSSTVFMRFLSMP